MASVVQPWQSYRTTAGHFDSLANELVEWLSWCHRQSSQAKGGPKASKLAEHRSKFLGGDGLYPQTAPALLGLRVVA